MKTEIYGITSTFVTCLFLLLLGGMWGFYNEGNIALAKEISRRIKSLASTINTVPRQKKAQISSFSTTMCIHLSSPSRLFTTATAAYNMETVSHFQLKELAASL